MLPLSKDDDDDNGTVPSANDVASSANQLPPAVPPRWRLPSALHGSTDLTLGFESPLTTAESVDSNAYMTRVLRPHRLLRVSVSCPRLCSLCQDYIVTPRCAAQQCSHCRTLLHNVCARQVARSQRILCTRSTDGTTVTKEANADSSFPTSQPDPVCSSSEQPLALWTEQQVADWLTVVGLSRFVMLFLRKKVDGNVLRQLVPHSSHLDQVVDPFARQALRRAILVLSGMQPAVGEDIVNESSGALPYSTSVSQENDGENTSTSTTDNASPKMEHDFKIFSFTREVACVVCGLPLLGLLRQGYQCHTCGMIFHRVCRALDSVPPCPQAPPSPVPECESDQPQLETQNTLDYTHLPRRLIPYRGDYFMVALENQAVDPNSGIPVFLLTCTDLIERIATESLTAAAVNPAAQPVNLVTAYQQSASASTLTELRRTYAHSLPSLASDPSSSEPLDVVRLAQLVKAFLRDLPHAVIWEEQYQAFCDLASLEDTLDRTKAVRDFLASLPSPHRVCLTHVMKHLDFVWTHQRKLRDHLNASVTVDTQPNCLDNSTGASSAQTRRRANQHLTRPDNWLLVFRQILVRPPWHLVTHIATALDVHLQSLKVLFYTLASPPPFPSTTTTTAASGMGHATPVVLRPRLPPKLATGRLSPSPQRAVCQSAINTEYGVLDMPSPSISIDSPPGPTVDTPPSPQSVAENKRDLCTREWYWGDVTQAEVREIMDGLADGYFLVRDASSRSAGAFTLAVRWHGENKLNRIYHRGDYFGVVDPPAPIFRLVSELIDYYRTHTPKPGEHMGMQLLWPISHRHHRYGRSMNTLSPCSRSSAPTSPTGQPPRIDERSSLHDTGVFDSNVPKTQLFADLFETGAKLVECETRLQQLTESVGSAMAASEEAAKLIAGHQKLKEWLTGQLKRLDEYAVPQENAHLVHQRKLINERLHEVERQIKTNTEQHTLQSSLYRIFYEQQVGTMLQQRKLRRQVQEIRRALKNLGVHEEAILDRYGTQPSTDFPNTLRSENLPQFSSLPRTSRTPDPFAASNLCTNSITTPFRQRSSSSINTQTSPTNISRRSTWFVQTITREQVEELLASKPPGTFLIRPSTDGRRFALGVRLESSIQHCLIHHVNGKYGFVKSSCSFDSLEDLVRYYHVNSLKQHNSMLTTTLRYPINSI